MGRGVGQHGSGTDGLVSVTVVEVKQSTDTRLQNVCQKYFENAYRGTNTDTCF